MSGEKAARRARTDAIFASEDKLEELFIYIATDGNFREWCHINQVPYATVRDRIVANQELNAKYEAALQARADHQRERIEELTQKVENNEIDPKAAAVAIAGRQWLAKVLNRKRYGDQQQLDVAVTDKTALHLEALRQLARKPRTIEALVLKNDPPLLAEPIQNLTAIPDLSAPVGGEEL
jgi:hypothetical protein